jgi:hypothetical protein
MEKTNANKNVSLNEVIIDNESYYKISNSDALRPFLMSLVSNANHWMFISSNGGLSAGRKNADNALFPYYTDDKITESAEITGSKTILLIHDGDSFQRWEPFSDKFDGTYTTTRNLYKNIYGNKIIFEEINHSLELTFKYSWNTCNIYGFVKTATLANHSNQQISISILDGVQNILPYGINSDLQNQVSNLVDAYKRNELDESTGLGIFTLSAIIVDKAEPSEALKANIAWSIGLDNPKHLLSSLQLNNFRNGIPLKEELDIKAEKGAYWISTKILLAPEKEKEWMIIADINKNHSALALINHQIKNEKNLIGKVKEDINVSTQKLIELNAASDGLQLSSDNLRDSRHFSNTLFNIMRGGIFDFNYQIEKTDLITYLKHANRPLHHQFKIQIESLPETFDLFELKTFALNNENPDLKRLCLEYLPLKFSRRHGDPSRPWNKFSINTHSEIDGSKILDYEGNWRDIFQNWEALVHSYPEFIESMIHKFLNASTFEGYNPYRITKDGFDWETIEPDNPWSYIGYWGDHQIIYLLKFLEFIEKHQPGKLESYFDQEYFVYANVPYQIKTYEEILKDPKNTIEFNVALDRRLHKEKENIGADATLLNIENGATYYVNFIEKTLAIVLSKLSNFIPEGGIWMNTQRPEWNDANNALVGNGISVVTLCYLRRFLSFFRQLLLNCDQTKRFKVSNELIIFYKHIRTTFEAYEPLLSDTINNETKKTILDNLGQAASDYRQQIYKKGFWGQQRTISVTGLIRFVDSSLHYLEHTIRANKRKDNLYHAYNLMTLENEKEISISYLSEMLEGQVAILSSGYLTSKEALQVLDALKNSSLFRTDQYSYLLYPNKNLPRFNEKNSFSIETIAESELLKQLIQDEHINIIEKDINNILHFNGNFKNANDLAEAIDLLVQTKYAKLAKKDKNIVLEIFEKVFNHKAFTGRSGTFFGYEGLGSIYWHMVSKLQLAVQECCLKAIEQNESPEIIGRLLEHYYEINAGIGVHKSPALYGAFPTDPYSHTPAGKGAQQPGMTGQVKEDILARFGELGIFVKAGNLCFNPCLLRKSEFLENPITFNYIDVHAQQKQLPLQKGMLCFTYCQVPIIYIISATNSIEIIHQDNTTTKIEHLDLDAATSAKIFKRSGEISMIKVHIIASKLK